jgi:hypothetical protein
MGLFRGLYLDSLKFVCSGGEGSTGARSACIVAGESSTNVSRLYASMDAVMLSVSSSSSLRRLRLLPSPPLNICIDSNHAGSESATI